ncbi:MAG: hypothetical protein AYK19_07150 [Theionarchaea archaeon DG-70-1]|nr:MAG: hypothetical protein AYK19_07150 [Theionarchaea archaeon DG-70-1]
MRRLCAVAVLLVVMAAQIQSQDEVIVPQYLAYDDRIVILEEHLGQTLIELTRSLRVEPNEWYADVYLPTPPDYFLLAPDGSVMQRPSDTNEGGEEIYLGPNNLYLVILYDFEHDLIIEAGEWKDINGNIVAESAEWFDENGNGTREFGEWIDANSNGIVDLNELNDLNGNGVFDIGEWHEGKNTDGNPLNNLPGEFNGAVDPDEWIGMNRDRSITKKLALKIYKKIYELPVPVYKEIDYQHYIFPVSPARVFQHPALKAMTTITDNQKLVLLLRLEECERCEIVGDVAWYEDEFARIVFNFQGFFRETLHTTLPRCEGCYLADITHYAKLQIYIHEKYELLYENFYLHTVERRGLPDNQDGTTAYYYTALDERPKEVRSLVSFDPYYLMIRGDNELVLFETIYGKALIVPYEQKEEEYSFHIYKRKFPDGTEKNIRVELVHVYQIETLDCEQIIVIRLLIDEDTFRYNTDQIDPDEKLYTVFYFACDDHFENNIIFPEEHEVGLTDFAIIVEKVELESEKVYLKFVREVDSETIVSPSVFPYAMRDYQIVFDELDRHRPLGACDFYPKNERYVPRFEKILVDICLPIRDLLNNVVLKYDDLKGNPTSVHAYEEQPWEMDEWNTEVTIVQIKKVAYNPNAADWTGLGYGDIPVYIPPLDPAPGLVQIGPNLIPNFQISDENFSGTCVPQDVITFYIEVFNGAGVPIPVQVQDDIPQGMFNGVAPHIPPPPLVPLPPGSTVNIADTNGDTIVGNGGDIITWNIPSLPPGYTLLTYQAEVLSDGSVNFGGSITNSSATVYYFDAGIPRSLTAPTVTILVQAAQLVKEAFQDLACTIPAPIILPGSRLYYRLTAYNTVDPFSPVPYTARITEITDVSPPPTTNPQYHVSPPGLAPQPIVANTVSWQGMNLLGPGGSISGIYSVFVPIGSAGRISNSAQLTYDVGFPPPGGTTVTTTSNTYDTWIQTFLGVINEPLEPCINMTIEKRGPYAQAAGNVHYRIRVNNRSIGPYADAFNVVVIDKIPQYTTLLPASITSTNPLVTWNLYDSDGDGAVDTIVFKLSQMAAGDQFELEFDVSLGDIPPPYNCYVAKVFTYDLYNQEQDRYLGMGGIARSDQYKVTPEDMTEVVTDAVFTQVMKGSEKLENYLIKVFESRFYDKKFYFDFIDFNEKERSARFRLFTQVKPDIDMNIYWGILEEVSMDTGASQIHSDDTFLAHILLRNDGNGTASEISYELDAPDFHPVDMTWVYNLDQNLILEISPEEQAGLLFLMKAPSVSKETTFPVKVRITYSDGLETRTETKMAYLNVLSQRRASINLQKTILEGKSVVEETGREVADMRVGEERTIVAYIKNLSEEDIKQVHYIDQIPQGLEVIEGHAEWMGTLKPGEIVRVTYKIRVKQIGVYQFRGKTFYKDERDHVYEAVSNITEIRVVTEPGPRLHRELDSDIVSKGDTITVVIRVENDTVNPVEHIQVVDILPDGFTVEKLETRGLKEDEGTIRYYIDELESKKYILLKYTLKAGEKAGKFTFKGVRLAYENGDGLKQEVVTEDQVVMIPETESPNVGIDYDFRRKVDSDGEYITVILTLPNMGGISAKDIKIKTNLPEGAQFLEASTDYIEEGGNITFFVDEIQAGEEFIVKYTVKVPHFNQDKTYDLTFDVPYSDDFDREYSAQRTGKFDVKAQKPNVRVTKVVDKSEVKLNFSMRVAVNVINEGEIPATTNLVDPLPEGMVLLSGTNEWEGRLEPGESAQIIYEMLCTRVGSLLLPTATATYQDKWKIIYTAESESTIVIIRGIQVEKTADVDSAKVGEVVVVTVSVTNTYDERATNVVVKDWVPEEFTVLEGDTQWNIGVLNPGEEVTFTYSLKPTARGSFNLGAAKATFIDVYNDKHESMSASISVMVEEMIPVEEEREIPTEEIEEVVETITERLARSFDITFILIIFLIMAVSMMLAFLLIERRRTEEETYAVEEFPPTPIEREEIWKEEVAKPALPTPVERVEAMEEITPLDILRRRRERMEETKEEVEKVAKVRDVHELLEAEEGEEAEKFDIGEVEEFKLEKEPKEFDFGKEPVSKAITKEELGLEDLFEEEESKEPERTEFTDVREILRRTKEEEKAKKETTLEVPEWEDRTEDEELEIPDIRELIKGPSKKEEKEEKSEENESDEPSDGFNPRDILKMRD